MINFIQKGKEWFTNHISEVGTVKKQNCPVGMMVYTKRFIDTEPSTKFFANPTVGIAMNQNVAFGAVAVTLHDGGTSANGDSGTADTNTPNHVIQSGKTFTNTTVIGSVVNVSTNYANVTNVTNTDLTCDDDIAPGGNEAYVIDPVWVGTVIAGTWNFADSGEISLTSGNNNDEASIDGNTLALLDMDNFTAFTGKINLSVYAAANTNIVFNFDLDGVQVGNSINLDDFIDTGDFTQQMFAIPKASLGLSGQTVNGMTFKIIRSGGAKPTFTLDDLQMEASGDPLEFNLSIDQRERFHISELTFAYADAFDGTVTGGTMPGIPYDAILGVSALPIGFNITRSKKGKTLFNVNIRTLGAHVSAGAVVSVAWDDDTNVFVILKVEFPDPLILTGDSEDILTITINDPMNGLLQFTASARGVIEKI